MLQRVDHDLQLLIAKGKAEGQLTYEEVSAYLPDEIEGTDRIDALLAALDGLGIELVDSPDAHRRELAEQEAAPSDGDRSFVLTDGMPHGSSDPIRMYLSQMAHIPLLTREEEIGLAKKIELTRKRFRRNMLRSFFALEATVKTLERVHQGELPFDRTIKVSLTERLTKEQVQARMPHNLPLLAALDAGPAARLRAAGQSPCQRRGEGRGPHAVHPPPRENARAGGGIELAHAARAAAYSAIGRNVAAHGPAAAAARGAPSHERSQRKDCVPPARSCASSCAAPWKRRAACAVAAGCFAASSSSSKR